MYPHITPEHILRKFVGFEDALDRADGNHPPHDVVKLNESTYVIGIAAAGFGKDDITITHHQDTLAISGRKEKNHYDTLTEEYGGAENAFIYQKIGHRDWERRFKLGADIKVERAEYVDGVLYIILQKIIPDELKPKKIAIK